MSLNVGSAVITGAGAGIGRQIARRFLDRDVLTVVNDVSESALAETRESLGDDHLRTVQGDASDPDTAERLIETAIDGAGSMDVLVNNVGVAGPTKPCEEITREEFMETIEVNLGSLFTLSSRAIPVLRDGGGSIVNIASISGKKPLPNRIPYTTSKMGVIGFTRTLAMELAPDVRVNAICPGSVAGPRMDAVIEGQAESRGISIEEARKEFVSDSPMRTMIDPEDIAELVVFLSSDGAARITGQDINVSAGAVMY